MWGNNNRSYNASIPRVSLINLPIRLARYQIGCDLAAGLSPALFAPLGSGVFDMLPARP